MKSSTMTWPDVFLDISQVTSKSDGELLADALCAWGIVHSGMCGEMPKSFGNTLVAIATRLKMTKAPTGENLMALSREMFPEKP